MRAVFGKTQKLTGFNSQQAHFEKGGLCGCVCSSDVATFEVRFLSLKFNCLCSLH